MILGNKIEGTNISFIFHELVIKQKLRKLLILLTNYTLDINFDSRQKIIVRLVKDISKITKMDYNQSVVFILYTYFGL